MTARDDSGTPATNTGMSSIHLTNETVDVAADPSTPIDDNNPRTLRRMVSSIDTPIVKTGILGSSANLVNSIVGAGIIGIPYSIKESGLIAGIILLLLVGYLTDKSLRIIIELATYHPKLRNIGVLTYEDMMKIPFGLRGKRFVLAAMFIEAYGAMVAYLLIIKDTVPTILGLGNSFVEREMIMLITSLLIIVPLSMLRDISQLSVTSVLSVLADTFLVLVVIYYSPYKATVAEESGIGTVIAENWINSNLFIGLGVISTAMACQHSAFLISGTLEYHTPKRWSRVTGTSLFVATTLSLLLGVFGYLGYLDETKGDILLNFDQSSKFVNIGRGLLAITMFFTYPMESFVARHVLVQLLYNGNMDNTTVGPNGEQIPESKLCCGRREQITIVLYILTLIPALIFHDLGPVLSITGSLGASCLAYIAPGLAYLGINGSDFCQWAGVSNTYDGDNQMSGDGDGEIELPVVGDATATMTTVQQMSNQQPPRRKVWWWYLVGMPLWVSIARSGDSCSRRFLSEFGVDDPGAIMNSSRNHPNEIRDDNRNSTTIVSCRRDFIFSIFFVIFGFIALVCGLASNIWVQTKDIFFSPS